MLVEALRFSAPMDFSRAILILSILSVGLSSAALTTLNGRFNRTTASKPGVEATYGHEYALAGLKNPPPKIYGAKVTMNVWQPKVEQVSEFSLGQIWVTSGTYQNNELNSIEAGWQVFPELYKDYQPHLFIFWTTDGYTSTHCYNLRCAGFIQTNPSVVIEGPITPSTVGGAQTELTIQIWKDPNPGPWWLAVGFNNGTNLTTVGYWPTHIFTRLNEYAENVQWGGEIVNNNITGRHTITQMGSGYLPGNDKAAYMRDLQIAVNLRVFESTDNLIVGGTNVSHYSCKKFSNTSFSYGGPEHARADRLGSRLFYFCFGVFLLF